MLLAENNALNQKTAQLMLHRGGPVVDPVEDGWQAVQACRVQDDDLVLMDGRMPEIDGWEATRQIRQLEKAQPRMIAVTAQALVGDREKCLACGMDEYLSKPYTSTQRLSPVQNAWKPSPEKQ